MKKTKEIPITIKDDNEYDSYQMKKDALPLLAKSGADPYEIATYWAIKHLSNWNSDEGKIYISTIAKYSGQSQRGAANKIESLKEKNFISVTQNYNFERKQFLASTYKLLPLDKIAKQMQFEEPDKEKTKEIKGEQKIEPQKTLEYIAVHPDLSRLLRIMKEKFAPRIIFTGDEGVNILPIIEELCRHEQFNVNKKPLPVKIILETINRLELEEVENVMLKISNTQISFNIDHEIPYVVTVLYNAGLTKAAGMGSGA